MLRWDIGHCQLRLPSDGQVLGVHRQGGLGGGCSTEPGALGAQGGQGPQTSERRANDPLGVDHLTDASLVRHPELLLRREITLEGLVLQGGDQVVLEERFVDRQKRLPERCTRTCSISLEPRSGEKQRATMCRRGEHCSPSVSAVKPNIWIRAYRRGHCYTAVKCRCQGTQATARQQHRLGALPANLRGQGLQTRKGAACRLARALERVQRGASQARYIPPLGYSSRRSQAESHREHEITAVLENGRSRRVQNCARCYGAAMRAHGRRTRSEPVSAGTTSEFF